MPSFTLSLYQDQPATTVKIGIGKLTFEVADETAAVRRMHELYPERVENCDYAILTDEAGKLLWEKPRASAPGVGQA